MLQLVLVELILTTILCILFVTITPNIKKKKNVHIHDRQFENVY